MRCNFSAASLFLSRSLQRVMGYDLFSIPWWLVLSAIHKTLIFLEYIFIYSYGSFFKAFYWFMLFIYHLQVTVPALVIFFNPFPRFLLLLIFLKNFCVLYSRINPFCSFPFLSIRLIRKLGPITCLYFYTLFLYFLKYRTNNYGAIFLTLRLSERY